MSVYLSLTAYIITARHFLTSLYLKRFQFCFPYEKLLLWELQWQCLAAVLLRWLKKNRLVCGCRWILPNTIGKDLGNFVCKIGKPCSQTEAGSNVSFTTVDPDLFYSIVSCFLISVLDTERIMPVFRELHWLRVLEWVTLQLCILAYRIRGGSTTMRYTNPRLYFLSASLYVSKRGAYWDRLCRDVVGRWLVVGRHARALWPNGAS